jgi:hypothetical protein
VVNKAEGGIDPESVLYQALFDHIMVYSGQDDFPLQIKIVDKGKSRVKIGHEQTSRRRQKRTGNWFKAAISWPADFKGRKGGNGVRAVAEPAKPSTFGFVEFDPAPWTKFVLAAGQLFAAGVTDESQIFRAVRAVSERFEQILLSLAEGSDFFGALGVLADLLDGAGGLWQIYRHCLSGFFSKMLQSKK